MKPRITVITLGADNLEKSAHFYRDGLGLPTEYRRNSRYRFGRLANGTETCPLGPQRHRT